MPNTLSVESEATEGWLEAYGGLSAWFQIARSARRLAVAKSATSGKRACDALQVHPCGCSRTRSGAASWSSRSCARFDRALGDLEILADDTGS
jgi:hypothetical protein